MADRNRRRSVSRRTVLRRTAAGASAGFAGVSSPVAARRDSKPDELRRLERTPEVGAILEELGYGSIPRKGTAETTSITADDLTLLVTEIDFGYGYLRIGRLNGETSAAFSFETDGESGDSGGERPYVGGGPPMPEKYRSVPTDSDAWLVGSETGATFVRTATGRERRTILESIPASDTESTLVYTRSDIDGFRVDVLDDGDDPSVTDGDDGFRRYTVPTTEATAVSSMSAGFAVETSAVEVEWISRPARRVAREVAEQLGWASLQAVVDHCGIPVGSCVSGALGSISGCMRCAPACVGSPTGVGAVVCFLCVFGVCSHLLTGISCTNAVDCVTD